MTDASATSAGDRSIGQIVFVGAWRAVINSPRWIANNNRTILAPASSICAVSGDGDIASKSGEENR